MFGALVFLGYNKRFWDIETLTKEQTTFGVAREELVDKHHRIIRNSIFNFIDIGYCDLYCCTQQWKTGIFQTSKKPISSITIVRSLAYHPLAFSLWIDFHTRAHHFLLSSTKPCPQLIYRVHSGHSSSRNLVVNWALHRNLGSKSYSSLFISGNFVNFECCNSSFSRPFCNNPFASKNVFCFFHGKVIFSYLNQWKRLIYFTQDFNKRMDLVAGLIQVSILPILK